MTKQLRRFFGVLLLAAFFSSFQSYGQTLYSIRQDGEFGVGIGASHYFGDLNTKGRINRAKPAASIFFRKNFSNYVALRIAASFASLGYSDVYNGHNEYMRRRNLSFNSNVWELSVQGDFNFFRFMPGEPGLNFTPYVTLGLGAFSYDPYAYLNDEKIFLRTLGTEGQGIIKGKKQYSSMAFSLPIGAGVKYAINEKINIGFELLHRLTTTDYLDDVSTTYVSPSIYPTNPDGSPSTAALLSDRSYELGTPIGKPGFQRGNSKQKDQFITALFYVTFNLQSYKCPTAK